MNSPEKQTTSTILVIRPANFGFNEETFETCPFQKKLDIPEKEVQKKALEEFDGLVDKLVSKKVDVLVFEDTPEPKKPDAIFPNNWVTFHQDGRIALYPMLAPVRRLERRMDIIVALKRDFGYPASTVFDFTSFEKQNLFLEGTGSMVLDRLHKTVYACLSPRTSIEPLEKFTQNFGYKPITFHTKDKLDMPIYHTNVVMSVGEKFAVACLEAIDNRTEKRKLFKSLKENHDLITISLNQLYKFCGNILQVENKQGEPLTVMSEQARKAFSRRQLSIIEKYSRIISIPFYTIETVSGGSVRCTMAEIFPPQSRDHTTEVL